MTTKFHARCSLKRAVPLIDLPEDVFALVDADVTTPGRIRSRWDRKLGNVVDLPCALDTTDRETFEEHMKTVHGRRSTRRSAWYTPSTELPPLAGPLWRMPRPKALVPEEWTDRYDVTLTFLEDQDVAS